MSRLTDEVLRRLRQDIVSGTYPPGTRLTESQLCAAYDVSRVPVRESLKQLEVEGFVASRAYAGVTVAQVSGDEAVDLFVVRRTIETITAKRAARRALRVREQAEVARLCERIEQLVETGSSALGTAQHEELPPLNTEFHLVLAELSGNPSMLSLLKQVSAKIEWHYAMDVDVRGEHSWAEHRQIADAVVAGRATVAGRLMSRHVDNSMAGYLLRHAGSTAGG